MPDLSINMCDAILASAGVSRDVGAKNFENNMAPPAKIIIICITFSLKNQEVLQRKLLFLNNGESKNNSKCSIKGFSKLKILSIIPYDSDLIKTLQNSRLLLEVWEILRRFG
jgi:hypothetical protein